MKEDEEDEEHNTPLKYFANKNLANGTADNVEESNPETLEFLGNKDASL